MIIHKVRIGYKAKEAAVGVVKVGILLDSPMGFGEIVLYDRHIIHQERNLNLIRRAHINSLY
jgi:hypothetical protein